MAAPLAPTRLARWFVALVLVAGLALGTGACSNGGGPAVGADAASPRALFEYDAGAELDVQVHVVDESTDGYRRTDLDYVSPAGGRVPAHLYEPDGEGPHAAIVLMHGSGGGRESVTGLAAEYAELGAVVLAINAPFARPDGSLAEFVSFTEQVFGDEHVSDDDLAVCSPVCPTVW
jgi:hypothetical protein